MVVHVEVKVEHVVLFHAHHAPQRLDGVEVGEAESGELERRLLHLFDAGRERADAAALGAHRLLGGRERLPRTRQVQEDGVGHAAEREAIVAHVAVVDGHVLGELMGGELVARHLCASLVELERVQVAVRIDGAYESVRERGAARARLDHHRAGFELELERDHADVRRVDDFRAEVC